MTASGALGFFLTCAGLALFIASHPNFGRRQRILWCVVGGVFLLMPFVAAVRALL